jgi:poly(3-hydroxybutyrate) depolymerase
MGQKTKAVKQRIESWLFFVFLAFLLPLTAVADSSAKVSFGFDGWEGPALRVFATRPPALTPERPVVFVMHGMGRNADEYRDQWHQLALKYDFLLIVPEFSENDFPGTDAYNIGNVYDQEGKPLPRELWSFSAIEPIFDAARARFGMTADAFSIYGHSAGAQFVHRFLFHVPEARVARAVAANAGWYTLPDFSIEYPYGLGGSRVTPEGLQAALSLPLTILLGDRDTDPAHESLRRTPEALQQGQHRMARGFHFFDAGRKAAVRDGAAFNWHLATVLGADHDNRLMAEQAARFLLPQNADASD